MGRSCRRRWRGGESTHTTRHKPSKCSREKLQWSQLESKSCHRYSAAEIASPSVGLAYRCCVPRIGQQRATRPAPIHVQEIVTQNRTMTHTYTFFPQTRNVPGTSTECGPIHSILRGLSRSLKIYVLQSSIPLHDTLLVAEVLADVCLV